MAQPPTPEDTLVGKRLGRYRIVRFIGQGGFARVYLAVDESLDRQVALKVLLRSAAETPEFVKRFQREARVAARLDHPNIVKIYDVGFDEGLYYLAMAYVDGGSLQALLVNQRSLPVAKKIGILRQVARALDYAHRAKVVHRDVKPSNILLGKDGTAYLTDFGIAKAAWSTRVTMTGASLGTPEYMSPEQANGKKEVDYRTDLYSLGVIAYEMLSGRRPYEGENPLSVLYKIVHEQVPPPQKFNKDIPPAAEQVLLRALAKEPQDRFKSGEDMVRALEIAFAGKKTPTPLPNPRMTKRNPLPIGALGIVGLAVVVGGLVLLGGRPPMSDRLPSATAWAEAPTLSGSPVSSPTLRAPSDSATPPSQVATLVAAAPSASAVGGLDVVTATPGGGSTRPGVGTRTPTPRTSAAGTNTLTPAPTAAVLGTDAPTPGPTAPVSATAVPPTATPRPTTAVPPTPTPLPPDPPQGLNPCGGSFNQTDTIHFSWFGNGIQFLVEISGPTPASSGWIPTASWSRSGLLVGDYTWRVKARNAYGESDWSTTCSFSIRPPTPTPPPPDAPWGLNPCGGSFNQTDTIHFSWSGNGTQYLVEISGPTPASSGWIPTTSWSGSGFSGGNYTWRVKARNAYGESGWSASCSFNVTSPFCDCVQIWNVDYPRQVQVGQYVTIRWQLCTQASGVGHNNFHWGTAYCGNDANSYPNTSGNQPGLSGWYQDGFVAPSTPGTICFIVHASAGPNPCQQAQAGVYQIQVVQ